MKKIFKQLGGIILCLSLILSSSIYTSASEEPDSKIDFTESIAEDIGTNFAKNITGEKI